MANSTLTAIRTKVRRLTRSPSPAQLSDADIDEYVNTFLLYDVPEHLRLFDLRQTLTFYTSANIDVYETNTTDPNNPLYNFKNRYMTVHLPVYIGGYQVMYSQDRSQFFSVYPRLANIVQVDVGDGVTTSFSGTLGSAPVLQNQVIFTTVNSSNTTYNLIDYPLSSALGALGIPGVTPDPFVLPYGSINYLTGAFTVNFSPFGSAPASGVSINSETVPYVASIPQAMLYYNDTFTLRPVPDQGYAVNMEVYVRPTELLSSSQSPDLEQWWQWIAYGAAKKVFEDRMDIDSVSMIMPEYTKQEILVLRKTLVQYSNDRAATIYTENVAGAYGSGYFYGGGQT